MKKFLIGLLGLAPMFGIAFAMTGTYVTEQPSCNDKESKTIDVYMTGDTYTIYPYDAYWNTDSDVLINNKTSVQIWSDGTTISGCYGDAWALMSNYVAKGKPSNQGDRTLLLRTKNQAGCVLHKPTKIRNNATDKNAIFHYTIGFKKVDSNQSNTLTEKFYYTTPNSSKYFCVADKQRKNQVSECSKMEVGYDSEQQYHVGECLNYRIFWCGDGIFDKEHEQCDPASPEWKNGKDGKTCNAKCEIVNDKIGPKLWIKKTFSDGSKEKKVFKVGDTIEYKISFGNKGTAPAKIVSIKDFLPKNVAYLSSEIFIGGEKVNTNSVQTTQQGEMNIFKGFKVEDGIRIDVFGGLIINPGVEGYIILKGTVLGENLEFTKQNWACIYVDDQKPDDAILDGDQCDFVEHTLSMSCQPTLNPSSFAAVCVGDSSTFSTTATCRSTGGKANLEIICNGAVVKTGYAEEISGICSSNVNNTDIKVQCKVNGSSVGTDGKACEASFRRNTTSCGSSKEYAICNKLVQDDGYVKCSSTNAKAHFKLVCDGKEYFYDDSFEWSHTFKQCKNPVNAACYVQGRNDSMRKTNDDCRISGEKDKSTTDPEQCFNVNAGNFSIEEAEILPFYWNMRNIQDEEWVRNHNYVEIKGDYKNASSIYKDYEGKSCGKGGSVAKDSMVCEFNIYDGDVYHKGMVNKIEKDNPLYTIEGPCLSKKSVVDTNPLIEARYETMKDIYCNNPKDCEFYEDLELPTAVYYIQGFGSNASVHLNAGSWEGNWSFSRKKESQKSYGEYKIELSKVKYLQCGDDKSWEQKTPDIGPCQGNFTLTNSYTVQKTPSGNLRASTEELDKYRYYNGTQTFAQLINAIQTTAYTPNAKVKDAMDNFISKYEKLAVKVDNVSKIEGGVIKKVPGKDIYFVEGDIRIKGGTQNIKNAFTIVQTKGNVTIDGDVGHNMMLLTNGNITFKGKCTTDQIVKGIFYAGKNLIREGVAKNNDTSHDYRCTNGGLHVQGVLIGNNFENLMKDSRSNLNNWFDENANRKLLVMNGASVLIEYSPSIFTKSTMPPGAEDFTTALSIYKD